MTQRRQEVTTRQLSLSSSKLRVPRRPDRGRRRGGRARAGPSGAVPSIAAARGSGAATRRRARGPGSSRAARRRAAGRAWSAASRPGTRPRTSASPCATGAAPRRAARTCAATDPTNASTGTARAHAAAGTTTARRAGSTGGARARTATGARAATAAGTAVAGSRAAAATGARTATRASAAAGATAARAAPAARATTASTSTATAASTLGEEDEAGCMERVPLCRNGGRCSQSLDGERRPGERDCQSQGDDCGGADARTTQDELHRIVSRQSPCPRRLRQRRDAGGPFVARPSCAPAGGRGRRPSVSRASR